MNVLTNSRHSGYLNTANIWDSQPGSVQSNSYPVRTVSLPSQGYPRPTWIYNSSGQISPVLAAAYLQDWNNLLTYINRPTLLQTAVVTGLTVTNPSGRVYSVASGTYTIAGREYSSQGGEVQLDAPDDSLPRYDAIVIDQLGIVSIVKGETSAWAHAEVVDPSRYLVLRVVFVAPTAGWVTGSYIASQTITASNIQNLTITAAQIANATITGTQIANATISGTNIANSTITGANIANQTITGANIANQTITSSQIQNLTITASQIANLTITAAQIENLTINGDKIANKAIGTTKVDDKAITATQIADATITGTQIANATITGTNIANATITGTNIQNATITGTQIALLTITAGNIANATITATQIANATITSTQIANSTITGANIANQTIAAANLVNQTITASQIANLTITAAQIENLTINGEKIASKAVTGAKIDDQTITATNIANGTITALQIANATITSTQISGTAGITGSQIANATITATNIQNNTITATQIANNTITATQIANLTITADQIANLTITGGKLAVSTISANNLIIGNFDNLAEDPGFERGGSSWIKCWGEYTPMPTSSNPFSGWSVVSDGQYRTGLYSAKVVSPVVGTVYRLFNSSPIDCAPGDKFYASAYVKALAGSVGQLYIAIMFWGADGTYISNPLTFLSPTTSYQKFEVSATAPANATRCKIEITSFTDFVGTAYVDDIYIRRMIGTAIIEDASITTAKIANLAVTNAQINDVDASKITTGTLVVKSQITSGTYTVTVDAGNNSFTIVDTAGGKTILNPASLIVHTPDDALTKVGYFTPTLISLVNSSNTLVELIEDDGVGGKFNLNSWDGTLQASLYAGSVGGEFILNNGTSNQVYMKCTANGGQIYVLDELNNSMIILDGLDGKVTTYKLMLPNPETPSSAGANGLRGTIRWDSSYVYVCVDTNTWKRAALSTW